MENESVKSEQSSRSRRSRNHNNNGGGGGGGGGGSGSINNGYHRDRTRHSHRSNSHSKSSNKNMRNDLNPYQTTVNMSGDGSHDGQEVIEVQILPQDENWGENTTAVTGNTSEQSISMEDINNAWHREVGDTGFGFKCRRYLESIFSFLLGFGAFFSPVAMVVMPHLGFFPSAFDHPELTQTVRTQLLACGSECKGGCRETKQIFRN